MYKSKNGKIQLLNMDCMDYMKTYKDNSFDLAIVDPPYGLNTKLTNGGTWASKYGSIDSKWDIKPNKLYFDELIRISNNWIIWGGNYFIEFLPSARCFLIWDKIAKMETLADCELALTSFDKNSKIFSHVRNTNEKRIHITQKPVKLYEWLLQNYAKPNQRIIDTHLGSASSAIAAHYFGCDFVGIEIDKDYYDKSIQRFKKETSVVKFFNIQPRKIKRKQLKIFEGE